MVQSALQRVPVKVRPETRIVTVQDLPFQAAANTNIEVVESFVQKFLRVGGKALGRALFYTQFLEFEGDTAHHTPAIDQPPDSKMVPQWLVEMEEAIRVATKIGNKQAEVHRHHTNGQAHLARRAQQELDQLLAYAQTIQHSTGAPITSGALQMVASAGGGTSDSAIELSSTPTSQSIAAILANTPSATGPWGMGWEYDVDTVTSGETRYSRLEALVAHLVSNKPSPHIVERGSGIFAALAISLARYYRVSVIENLAKVRPNFNRTSPEIRGNIRLIDINEAPSTPSADVAIWIHPYPWLLGDESNTVALEFMGQDVVAGGYLVIQTEKFYITVRPNSDWELVYDGINNGYLAPTIFANGYGRTIVVRRRPMTIF